MQSICILLIRIEILKSLQPFPKSVMWDIASRVLRGLIFAVAHPGKLDSTWPYDRFAVVPKFTVLHQRVALSGARRRSVSLWHGMPTASVKD